MNRSDKKLILFELNEVPFRVLDDYCARRPSSGLAKLLPRTLQYRTVTEDRLALDPWISWPTLHRGVNDEVHQILHLGQLLADTNAKYPPLWELICNEGLSVGVFGSLHSSCVPGDSERYSFYLPDYFDDRVFAHPRSLVPFQDLNLSMTRDSARNVSRKIPWKSAAMFMATAPFLGVRVSTVFDSAAHLVAEAFDRSLRVRRRVYQPLIMMDLFLKQMRATRPHFATFYTNHVAAAMHRYWAAAFPEDYGDDRLEEAWIDRYRGEIRFAMDKLDVMLSCLVRFVDDNPDYTLVVASSMGQAAIPAERTDRFLTVTDPGRLLASFGVPASAWRLRPAMVPCCAVVVEDQHRDAVAHGLASLRIDGHGMQRDRRPVAPMSYDEASKGFFQIFIQFDHYRGSEAVEVNGRRMPLGDAGLGFIAHEDGINCTAQHVPEGSLLVYHSRSTAASRERPTISTLDVAPSILRYFELPSPGYMSGTASLELQV